MVTEVVSVVAISKSYTVVNLVFRHTEPKSKLHINTGLEHANTAVAAIQARHVPLYRAFTTFDAMIEPQLRTATAAACRALVPFAW